MASRRTTALQHLVKLLQIPILFVMFSGMWLATKLGFTRQTFSFLGRGMQVPSLKIKAFKGYQPDARDVFVCTYAKSGTNWALQIAYQIAQLGQGSFEHVHDVVPWPENPMANIVGLGEPSTYAPATGMRVIKTHLTPEHVPYSPDARYIVVLRDPKEVFVSSYHFSGGMLPGGAMLPVEQWLDMFLGDDFPYGPWAPHVAAYWPWRARPNVLVLHYAEMKADPRGAVQQIARLMGVQLSDAQLAQVLEKSSFAYMKQLDKKFAPVAPFPFNYLLGKPVMIRKGERGGSGELLSPAQQAQIDDAMRADLARLKADLPYEELFAPAGPVAAGRG